jgi:hypothetical protein
MVGTGTRERIDLSVMWDPDVPHLGVVQSIDQSAMDHGPTADASADGEIDKVIQSLCCTPPTLGQGGGVYVRIETHLQAEFATNNPCEIDMGPARLGRRRDGTKGR